MVSVTNLITHVLCFTGENVSGHTPDYTVPVDAQKQGLNDMTAEQKLSETQGPQTAVNVDGQNVDSSARLTYRHYITGENHHHSRTSCL